MQAIRRGQTRPLRNCVVAVLMSMAVNAHAQGTAPTAEMVTAWRVECTGDGKMLECRAVQQIFQRETRRLVASALVRTLPDGRSTQMTIQLPLGLNLAEPVLVRVDNGEPERQSIQTCTHIGCFVVHPVSDRLLAALRTGHDLKITVQDPSKKPIDLALPLVGFNLAYDKAK